jgi:hypothetical protein
MLSATLLMAVIATYRDAAADGITPSEWVLVVISAFTTINVWATANIPAWTRAKTFIAAIGLVLNLLVAAIVGGITGDEWMFLALQFLGALGVATAPAVSQISNQPSARVTAR